jgi:hypothetical protein
MVEMKVPPFRRALSVRVLAVFIVMLAAACTWVWARSAATVPQAGTPILRLDTKQPGNAFALGAVGLSIDANELHTNHLNAKHNRLVRLMRLLGPSVLRIGGNSVDLSWWSSSGEPPPSWATDTVTPADLVVLRGLLHATGWRVLLGVDLGHFEPAHAADEARYARMILGADLVGIEIGNEPNSYGGRVDNLRPPTYGVGEYVREAEAYRQAIEAAAPGTALYGPALTKRNSWLLQMGAAAGMFTELTQHYYPTSTCAGGLSSSTVPLPTVTELLSPAVRQQEDEILKALAEAGALAGGRPTRIGETGTACYGNSYGSPVFASALWALDWTLRAASSGVKGLNFHGHFGICGAYTQSPICALSAVAARVGDVTPRPEYYGLLAASRLEGGRFVPASLIASAPLPNLTTWATLAPDGTVTIAIDNLAASGKAQPLSIPMSGYTATEEPLVGPSADARSGIALGGARVRGDGHWRPRSARLFRKDRAFHVVVRPFSAVIVTLHRNS